VTLGAAGGPGARQAPSQWAGKKGATCATLATREGTLLNTMIRGCRGATACRWSWNAGGFRGRKGTGNGHRPACGDEEQHRQWGTSTVHRSLVTGHTSHVTGHGSQVSLTFGSDSLQRPAQQRPCHVCSCSAGHVGISSTDGGDSFNSGQAGSSAGRDGAGGMRGRHCFVRGSGGG